MVIPPFYAYFMTIPFFIFGLNLLVFHIQSVILLTFSCYLLFKMIGKRAWYIILFFFLPLSVIFPSYNLFLWILFVVLIYLEEENKSDYLIGVVLGIFILTKQSVGFCMLLPSIYYLKNMCKIKRRLISFSIVILIFFSYLILTNSYMQFLDLCVFGLFDFASGNAGNKFIFYIFSIFILIGILYFIKKDFRDIKNYYVLAFYSIIIPLVDLYHIQIAFLSFLFIFYTKKINKFIENNKDKEIIFLDTNAYYYKIINDMPITYVDLINTGNWGFNGSEKMINTIKKKKDVIFLLDEYYLYHSQTDISILNYIIKYGKKIGSIGSYNIYVYNN